MVSFLLVIAYLELIGKTAHLSYQAPAGPMLLAQIFDAPGSSAGRKNLARAVCLLRNVTAKRKAAGEAEET